MNFKGGKGELCTRNCIDGKCKIMKSCLRPGASSGLHTHEGNCEIVYIISGTATFYYDGEKRNCKSWRSPLLSRRPCALHGKQYRY